MFDNIIGNEKVKNILENSLKANKVSHSYLFIGTEGIGKKLIAQELAKALLCNENDEYCNKCKACLEFDTNNNPDFDLIKPDGNSVKIDQIRILQEKIAEKPIISKKKIYVIEDSDMMTVEAQNCLLKTLEEPPEYATIILLGSNESAYLSTIKSRCTILYFENISNDLLSNYLKKNYQMEIKSEFMLEAFQGSIGKALKIKEKQEQYEEIEKLICSLENKDVLDILKMTEIIYKNREERFDILEYINIILINLAKKSNKYAECINVIEDAKIRIKANSNYDMCIDNMLLKLYEIVN